MGKYLKHPFGQAVLVLLVAYFLLDYGIVYIPPLLGIASAPIVDGDRLIAVVGGEPGAGAHLVRVLAVTLALAYQRRPRRGGRASVRPRAHIGDAQRRFARHRRARRGQADALERLQAFISYLSTSPALPHRRHAHHTTALSAGA